MRLRSTFSCIPPINPIGIRIPDFLGGILPHDPVGRSDRLFLVCTGEQHKIICFAKLWRQAATHEWITPKGTDDERYSLRELFQFLRFKPVWTHFLTILLSTVGTSLSSGTGTFFYTYIMKDLKLMSGVSVVSLVITLLGMAVAPVLANKVGKKNVFLAGIIVAVGGSLIRFIDVRSLLLIYLGAVFAGIGGGFIGPLAYGIQADNTMYVQYKTGKRAEAAVASLSSFVSKAAQGVAGAIPGYMLAATGFIGGAAQQPQSVEGGIIFCSIMLPLILCAAAGLVFGTLYPLGKKEVDEITLAIEQGVSTK